MTFAAKTGAAALLGCLALPAGPAAAQSDDVPLIMLKPQGAGALSSLRLEKLCGNPQALRQGQGPGAASDQDRGLGGP